MSPPVSPFSSNDKSSMELNRILLIEDSSSFGSTVRDALVERGYEVHWVQSFVEVKRWIDSDVDIDMLPYDMAIVDLFMPDSHDYEILSALSLLGLPCVVFSSTFSRAIHDRMLHLNLLDYLIKDNPHCIRELLQLLDRIQKNRALQALVVDDFKATSQLTADTLRRFGFNVFTVSSIPEARAFLSNNPETRLLITDYTVGGLSGTEFIQSVRAEFTRNELAIIGLSSNQEDPFLAVHFLKAGADDFLYTPFFNEEFFSRILNRMESLERYLEIQRMANHDYLTGLYNRRFLYEAGLKLFSNAKRGNIHLTVAVLDIDHFKKINDTYGHEAGDLLLKAIAKTLESNTRHSDILARAGGEEFYFLAVDVNPDQLLGLFNRLREAVANTFLDIRGEQVGATISIGVCYGIGETLESTMGTADEQLYVAKVNGRNQVRVVYAKQNETPLILRP